MERFCKRPFSRYLLPLFQIEDSCKIFIKMSLICMKINPTSKNNAKDHVKLTFLTVISLTERVCLGTNMADSNRRQGGTHVGENQEYISI